MRYYIEYDNNGNIIAIGTGEDGIEITEEEYNTILAEFQLMNEYAQKVYLQYITLDEIPEKYKIKVENLVKELIAKEESEDASSANYDELVNVIREGVNEI